MRDGCTACPCVDACAGHGKAALRRWPALDDDTLLLDDDTLPAVWDRAQRDITCAVAGLVQVNSRSTYDDLQVRFGARAAASGLQDRRRSQPTHAS